VVGIAAIALLIVSTFRFDAMISRSMVYAMIVVGFLPILGAIAINYVTLRRIGTYEKELSQIGIRLISAISRLGTCRQRQLELEGLNDPDDVGGQPHSA